MKVGFEEPRGRIHRRGPDDETMPEWSIRQRQLDIVDHLQLIIGEWGGIDVGELVCHRRFGGRRDKRPGISNADLVHQRRFGKESEIGVANINRLIITAQIKVIVLDDHPSRVRHAGHFHRRRQCARFGRHFTKLCRGPPQIAERKIELTGECRADVTRQPATRLQGGFQQDGKRHGSLTVRGKVPGIVRDVILGNDLAPRLQDPGDTPTDCHHTVQELEGGAGQAGNDAVPIKDLIAVTKGVRGIADGKGGDAIGIKQGGTTVVGLMSPCLMIG